MKNTVYSQSLKTYLKLTTSEYAVYQVAENERKAQYEEWDRIITEEVKPLLDKIRISVMGDPTSERYQYDTVLFLENENKAYFEKIEESAKHKSDWIILYSKKIEENSKKIEGMTRALANVLSELKDQARVRNKPTRPANIDPVDCISAKHLKAQLKEQELKRKEQELSKTS